MKGKGLIMPYAINDKVRVICIADDTGDDSHLQDLGIITSIIATDTGATPENPLYVIRFFGHGDAGEYWEEELIKEEEA